MAVVLTWTKEWSSSNDGSILYGADLGNIQDDIEGHSHSDILSSVSVSSPAQGNILYYNGTNWVVLAVGTSGYFLKTQGASANPVWADAVPGAGTITQSKLATTTGEVSSGTPGNNKFTLPGGEYGFYPQIKADNTDANAIITICSAYPSWTALTTSYATIIMLNIQAGWIYAQQRYVTASGQDHWLFLLIDKTTKEISSAYSAPDHPAYGNGGDFEKLPHPFGSYDAIKHEIVLVDNNTIAELKAQVTNEKSLLTLVNELYKPNMDKEEVYKPLHSGKFLGNNLELIQSIPDYIKVRKLIKLNAQELQEKENKGQLAIRKAEQEKIKREQNRVSMENKLKVLGLTEDEMETLRS